MAKSPQLNKVIHEPARLAIMSYLAGKEDKSSFTELMETFGMSKGNLSAHMATLEKAGYVEVTKQFQGKVPKTTYLVTHEGRAAFAEYVKILEGIVKNSR